jgi:hypothetical protein
MGRLAVTLAPQGLSLVSYHALLLIVLIKCPGSRIGLFFVHSSLKVMRRSRKIIANNVMNCMI